MSGHKSNSQIAHRHSVCGRGEDRQCLRYTGLVMCMFACICTVLSALTTTTKTSSPSPNAYLHTSYQKQGRGGVWGCGGGAGEREEVAIQKSSCATSY